MYVVVTKIANMGCKDFKVLIKNRGDESRRMLIQSETIVILLITLFFNFVCNFAILSLFKYTLVSGTGDFKINFLIALASPLTSAGEIREKLEILWLGTLLFFTVVLSYSTQVGLIVHLTPTHQEN